LEAGGAGLAEEAPAVEAAIRERALRGWLQALAAYVESLSSACADVTPE
jgi:hypothetical protein